MIDKDCYSYIFVCDNCGEGEEVSTWNEVKDCYSDMVVCDNWNEVLEFMREKEWQKKKNGNSWNHYCHECKEDKP